MAKAIIHYVSDQLNIKPTILPQLNIRHLKELYV